MILKPLLHKHFLFLHLALFFCIAKTLVKFIFYYY